MDKKELFLNEELRLGGFYELSIQVCLNNNIEPIHRYLNYIWSLPDVDGPFNKDYTKGNIAVESYGHQGLITLSGVTLPLSTYTIREEEGYNWFDVCFHTAAIEFLLGEEYTVWTINAKYPPRLIDFFMKPLDTYMPCIRSY